jgi:choline dehydrogenase-like flavoprotein
MERLRVVDVWAFPTQISGNPHAAVIMLGEKVSRIILESDTHAEGVAQSKCA